MWLKVNSFNYSKNTWKHVFNRGSNQDGQYPRTPGLFITPSSQRLHIRCGTQDGNVNPGIDESQFQLQENTWYYLGFVFQDKNLKFYVNGQLSEQYNFQYMPIHKGNLNMCLPHHNGYLPGFDGVITKLECFDKVFSAEDLQMCMKGQSNLQLVSELNLLKQTCSKQITDERESIEKIKQQMTSNEAVQKQTLQDVENLKKDLQDSKSQSQSLKDNLITSSDLSQNNNKQLQNHQEEMDNMKREIEFLKEQNQKQNEKQQKILQKITNFVQKLEENE